MSFLDTGGIPIDLASRLTSEELTVQLRSESDKLQELSRVLTSLGNDDSTLMKVLSHISSA